MIASGENDENQYYPGMFSKEAASADPKEDPFLALAHRLAVADSQRSKKSNNNIGGKKQENKTLNHHNSGRSPFSVLTGKNYNPNNLNSVTVVKKKSNYSNDGINNGTKIGNYKQILSPRSQREDSLSLVQRYSKSGRSSGRSSSLDSPGSKNNFPFDLIADHEKMMKVTDASSITTSSNNPKNDENKDKVMDIFDKVFSIPVERTKTGLVMKQQAEARSIAYNLELQKSDERLHQAWQKSKREQALEEAKKYNHRKKYAHIQSRYKGISDDSQGKNVASLKKKVDHQKPIFLRKIPPPDDNFLLEEDLLEKEVELMAKSYAQMRGKEAWILREMEQYRKAMEQVDNSTPPIKNNVTEHFNNDKEDDDFNSSVREQEEQPPIEDPMKLLEWVQTQLDLLK